MDDSTKKSGNTICLHVRLLVSLVLNVYMYRIILETFDVEDFLNIGRNDGLISSNEWTHHQRKTTLIIKKHD